MIKDYVPSNFGYSMSYTAVFDAPSQQFCSSRPICSGFLVHLDKDSHLTWAQKFQRGPSGAVARVPGGV